MFAVCVALVFGAKFALAATTADSWNGEWVREGSISGYFAKLTIKDATDKSLSYYLDSVEGGHVCNVSNGEEMNFEKATIVGDVAISQPYSDNGDLNNVLDPTYMMKLVKDKDIITITESSESGEGGYYCGVGATIVGRYVRNGKIKETTFDDIITWANADNDIKITAAEKQAITKLILSGYLQRFVENMGALSLTQNQKTKNKILTGFVPGVASFMEAIIVVGPKNKVWAAVVDGERVLYFTNVAKDYAKPPAAINDWRKGFAGKPVVAMNRISAIDKIVQGIDEKINENGLKIERKFNDYDSSFAMIERYKDSKNKIVKLVVAGDEDGEAMVTINYYYDNGVLIKGVYDFDNAAGKRTIYSWYFDKNSAKQNAKGVKDASIFRTVDNSQDGGFGDDIGTLDTTSMFLDPKKEFDDLPNVVVPEIKNVTESEHVQSSDILLGRAYKSTWPKIKNVGFAAFKELDFSLSFIVVTDSSQDISKYNETNLGVMASNYLVTYDKNNVLDVTIYFKGNDSKGFYGYRNSYTRDLLTGKPININRIIDPKKMPLLAKLCDAQLQSNIRQYMIGLPVKDRKPNEGYDVTFTDQSLNNYRLEENGITFYFDFGTGDNQPNGELYFSYAQLNDYLLKDGYLAKEIK